MPPIRNRLSLTIYTLGIWDVHASRVLRNCVSRSSHSELSPAHLFWLANSLQIYLYLEEQDQHRHFLSNFDSPTRIQRPTVPDSKFLWVDTSHFQKKNFLCIYLPLLVSNGLLKQQKLCRLQYRIFRLLVVGCCWVELSRWFPRIWLTKKASCIVLFAIRNYTSNVKLLMLVATFLMFIAEPTLQLSMIVKK